MAAASNSRSVRIVPLLIAVCLVGIPAQANPRLRGDKLAPAEAGGSGMAASAETSTYVFVPDQSKVVQTGGIAGVHWTYSIKGQFQLTIDPNAGAASFAHVDANATDDSQFKRTLDPNHVFNMTSLVGTVEPSGSIKFTGNASDGSDVRITVTLQDNLAHLIGQTTPPPDSADFFIFSLDAIAQCKYGGGSGTADDPYQIWTAEQMNSIGGNPSDWDKHFKLMADIDLSGFTGMDFNIIGYWRSYSDNRPFTGVFDGNNRTIRNFIYETTVKDYIGLLGYLGTSGEIESLRLEDVKINADSHFVGSLVGWNVFGTITNCHVTGSVMGYTHVGGLVGRNFGIIKKCYSTATVLGEDDVGGLAGWNDFGTIIKSHATGGVTGDNRVGGLVGTNWGEIANCYAAAIIVGREEAIGGLVGENELHGRITKCYSTSRVEGWSESEEVGGLAGENSGTITNCCVTGSVRGHWEVGGLVGHNDDDSVVTHCYSAGGVVGDNDVGGLAGYNDGGADILASFWDTQATNQANGVGFDERTGTVEVFGRITARMIQQVTFSDAGWDFVGEMENGTENIWAICEGLDYPKLAWQFVIADYNGDGHTDFMDFCIFSQRWVGTDSSFWCGASGTDLTNDRFIDFEDLMVLAENWLTGTAP